MGPAHPAKTPQPVRETDPTQDFQDCYPASKLPMTNPELPSAAVRSQKERIAADLPVFRQREKAIRKDRALEERLQRIWLELDYLCGSIVLHALNPPLSFAGSRIRGRCQAWI